MVDKLIAVVVFFAVIFVGSQRNTYLPFLGPTVLPGSLLKEPVTEVKKDATQATLFIDAPDNTKIVYWAAKPSEGVIFEDPYKAYNDYSNAGVTVVKNKQAAFVVDCPSSYKVPSGYTLKPHIHYRVVYPNGIMGQVQTLFVKC